MTKTVRIENADTNTSVKVIVEVWDKGYTAADGTEIPERIVETITLHSPCQMTGQGLPGVYLTSTRWLVVREIPA